MHSSPPPDRTEPLSGHSDPRNLARQFAEQRQQAEPGASQIGPYRILDRLGEGGMGVVYLAEQVKPIHRRVALKIVKSGMDSKQVIARFEAEREALALMNHRNVARVLDAGSTDQGRPYFVMEYVPGIPITEYCDTHRLTTGERLALFVDVCQAIQHAHQKGIIHRDLKPSNVLITVEENKAVAKVIDFGVAKATQQRLTNLTLFTQHGQLIGTPAYMSPEQAEMSALDVDTRTDIYSLGVMLYELLVGELPFDRDTLAARALAEIQRIIREVEPAKPSTRLSSMGDDSAAVAQKRRTESWSLIRQLRGDLDWIVMKCLEKDRTRRYATANDLAMDIIRHLNHEPVIAGPPSIVYRAQKFLRRNWGPVTAGAAVGLALSAGMVGTLYMYAKAEDERSHAVASAREATIQRQVADRERDVARQQAEVARQVKDVLVETFLHSHPGFADGAKVTARELLEIGANRVESGLSGQPLVQADLMRTLAAIYRNLGILPRAKDLGQKALDLLEKQPGVSATELAETRYDLGLSLSQLQEYAAAEPLLRSVVQTRLAQGGEGLLGLIQSQRSLAHVLHRTGRRPEAEGILLDAMARIPNRESDFGKEYAQLCLEVGELYTSTREDEKAARYLREAVATAQRLDSPDGYFVAQAKHYLANAVIKAAGEDELGQLDEAERLLDEAITNYRRVLPEFHPLTASALADLGSLLSRRRQLEEAERKMEEALAMQRQLYAGPHDQTAGSLTCLGGILRDKGDYARSAEYYREAVNMRRELFGSDHMKLAVSLSGWGATLTLAKEFTAAEQALMEAQKIFEAKLKPGNPWFGYNAERLRDLCLARGQNDAADRWASRMYVDSPP